MGHGIARTAAAVLPGPELWSMAAAPHLVGTTAVCCEPGDADVNYVTITKQAARELNRIAEWWAINRPAAPGAVRQDLQAALGLLVEQAGRGAPVPKLVHEGCSASRGRIRYWINYRVRGSRLEVLSVWHSSRGWPLRLESKRPRAAVDGPGSRHPLAGIND